MRRLILLLTVLTLCTFVFSKNQVDTLSVFSQKMKKEVKSVVILPENYSVKKHYPVVYLLHGYSDNYATWIKMRPQLKLSPANTKLLLSVRMVATAVGISIVPLILPLNTNRTLQKIY